MITIAVDAMGGDHAPAAIVDGAVAAARHLDIQIALVGVPSQVEQALDAHADWRSLPVTVVDAPDVIEMADPPATVRRKRPALATTIPTRGRPAVLLDAANVECRPQHLLQFAIMGGVYARIALGAAKPRIGLLSIASTLPMKSIGAALSSRCASRVSSFPLVSSSPDFIRRVEREIAAATVPHQ